MTVSTSRSLTTPTEQGMLDVLRTMAISVDGTVHEPEGGFAGILAANGSWARGSAGS